LFVGCDRWPGTQRHGPPTNPAVVQKLCGSDLGGPKAELHVWRDDRDAVTVYELVPDEDGTARGTTALYDSRGREQLRMPAIDPPSSPLALERDRRRDAVVEDSKRAETLACAPNAGR